MMPCASVEAERVNVIRVMYILRCGKLWFTLSAVKCIKLVPSDSDTKVLCKPVSYWD